MVRNFFGVVMLALVLSICTSCTPKPPYEVKSPCVSDESTNPWLRNPCIRRPINRDIV